MSAMKNLPPDIIEAILVRLPAKSLSRFKSVSKHWCSLISNPQFITTHLHLNHHPTSCKLICFSRNTNNKKCLCSIDLNLNSDDVSANEVSFLPPPVMWEIIWGSCNGLVLATDEDERLYLVNPTIGEIFKLPPFALPREEGYQTYGFGNDSSTDDYKVIVISFSNTDMFVDVYSLSNNSWRNLPNSPYRQSFVYLVGGVSVNNNLHWLIVRPNFSSMIIAFSLAKEEFIEMNLPDSLGNNHPFNVLVVIGGKLCVFNQLGKDLWVMEEYGVGMSWSKVSIHGVDIDHLKPICSVEDNNRDIVLVDDDRVVIYNVDERISRNVRILGSPSGFTIRGTYVESLVSPKCIRRIP
ncbi:F-box/kelch-repeat protein At3g06240 [Lactuca sativa]|uniref:F-box/kelch-repeat protein At3g06240 n=1 Tax=Lactuca sativa TaxID=4236 RepID=UPI000CD8B40F|nr:F-box/kelch-repeat protein At3g06240 [Lactuca sativa]